MNKNIKEKVKELNEKHGSLIEKKVNENRELEQGLIKSAEKIDAFLSDYSRIITNEIIQENPEIPFKLMGPIVYKKGLDAFKKQYNRAYGFKFKDV